jgi:hypothetical protein
MNNKNVILIFLFMLFIILSNEMIINYFYLYNTISIDNIIHYNFIESLKVYYNYSNTIQNQNKSELLNCLYISRYMGQDWNKKFFYFDNYNNLTDYCKYLIDHVKEELNTKLTNQDDNEKRKEYYKYINDLVLHTRKCIDLTSTSNQNYCDNIENIIESQTDIKKNMCLFNVDNQLCNQIKIENNTPMLNGYLDKNMTMYGRDFYSHNRNYKIHNLPNLEGMYETDNNNIILPISISIVSIISIGILIYYISS